MPSKVVIVGAGPAGATLSLLLAQRGIPVTLVEASRTFHRNFRGEGLMPSGLDALEQMGLLPMLTELPHRALDGWEVVINQRSLFRVQEPIEPGGKPCPLVSQPALLEALIKAARASSNFELLQGTPVQTLLWSDQRVLGVQLGDGRELTADLVIGTDGRNSVLRQRADLTIDHQSHSFDILWFRLADSPQFAAENIFYSIVQGQDAFGLFRSVEGNLQIGWALHPERDSDWKQTHWADRLASASPPWLAQYFRNHADTLEHPVLLSVMVGRCPQWWQPGFLLLGDAAHPMSPIRAQGINVALRDVVVATNYLVPLLREDGENGAIDAVLPKIQAAREPEIVRTQKLQQQEAAQAELLVKNPWLPQIVSQFAPLLRYPLHYSWVKRQRQLRQGVLPIQLRDCAGITQAAINLESAG